MRTLRKAVKTAKRMLRRLRQPQPVVDFVVCGTQKGGTSALDAYLREHAEICMAEKKEVHFFDNDRYFSGRTPDYATYHSWFDPKPTHKLIGEATPIYMYWFDAPRRIWEYNPDMKIVVVLRNPMERAFSHWNMERSRGADDSTFWKAIQNERQSCREALPHQHRVFSYVDRGFYLEQLRRIWTYFPTEQVLVIKNEDLRNHPDSTLRELCGFLGVRQLGALKPKSVHSLEYKTAMSEREMAYLRDVYEFEIKALERALNWHCSDWLDVRSGSPPHVKDTNDRSARDGPKTAAVGQISG
jgi:hypothetical protein